MLIATQYDWSFVAGVLAVPAASWACALMITYAALKRKKEWAWLVPAHFPVFISVPLTFSALTRGDLPDSFSLWSFLLPGALALIAVVLFVLRRKEPNKAPGNAARGHG